MYVLSVCTALQFPAPTADTALTLTSYSVPGASPFAMVDFRGGETEMMCWLSQEVVPCFLYWTLYWEMGSSLCGMVQFACNAGNSDDTALERDRPVTWEGTSETEKRNYVKSYYHGYNTCMLLCIVTQETQINQYISGGEDGLIRECTRWWIELAPYGMTVVPWAHVITYATKIFCEQNMRECGLFVKFTIIIVHKNFMT